MKLESLRPPPRARSNTGIARTTGKPVFGRFDVTAVGVGVAVGVPPRLIVAFGCSDSPRGVGVGVSESPNWFGVGSPTLGRFLQTVYPPTNNNRITTAPITLGP